MSRESAISGAYEDVEHDQPLLAGMDESNVRRREEGERLYTSSRRVCARYAHPAPPTVYIAHGGQGKPCGVHGGYDGLILLCFATRRDVYQPACISTGTQALVCVLPLLSLFLLLRQERQDARGFRSFHLLTDSHRAAPSRAPAARPGRLAFFDTTTFNTTTVIVAPRKPPVG